MNANEKVGSQCRRNQDNVDVQKVHEEAMAVLGVETLLKSGNASSSLAYNASECSIYNDEAIYGQKEIFVTFLSLYTLVFCGCFFGNLLVIVVLVTSRSLRSTTNIFLANLAIADLSVGVFCVYQHLLASLVTSWILGDFVCKMYHFIHNLSYTASIFILVIMSVERYLGILHPMTCRSILTTLRIRMSVVTVWLVSATLCVVRFHWAHTAPSPFPTPADKCATGTEPRTICILNRPRSNQELWDGLSFLLLYVVPLGIISTLYTRIGFALWTSTKFNIQQPGASPSVISGRRRAVRLLAVIVTTFAVCHLPLHGRRLWLHWVPQRTNQLSDTFTLISHLAAYSNSAVNPLLYSLLSRNFRAALDDLVHRVATALRWPSTSCMVVQRQWRYRSSRGDASDSSSPQTTLTSRGDSLRVPVKFDATTSMLSEVQNESGRDWIRTP